MGRKLKRDRETNVPELKLQDSSAEEAEESLQANKKSKKQESEHTSDNLLLPVVHNVKVEYIRPQYTNLKEWVADSNNIYIGRHGAIFVDGKRFPPKANVWASPYKLGKDGNRTQVVEKYYKYMKEKLSNDAELVNELKSLRGKSLGCWCVESPTSSCDSPIVCHGQMLIKLLKEFS
jgi:hypothetical protein